MMNTSKYVLLALFFGGLAALWWTDYAGIADTDTRRQTSRMILPELLRVSPADVRRVEIDAKAGQLAFERREGGLWEMVQPVTTRANSARIDSLVQTLRQLPKSGDAGTISAKGKESDFGLNPPEAVVRLFGRDGRLPVATLELGKQFQDKRYVRGGKNAGIDVIDPRLLGNLETKTVEWRQRSLFPVSPIDVLSVGLAAGNRKIKAVRLGGRWEITEPTPLPGDEPKFEGLAADLVSMEVTDGEHGFVEDHAKSLAAYGLEPPLLRFELESKAPAPRRDAQNSSAAKKVSDLSNTHAVMIGKEVPGEADRRYACVAGTSDVVIVKSQFLKNYKLDTNRPLDTKDFRSLRLANLDSARISHIALKTKNLEHYLVRGADGWKVLKPAPGGRADENTVGRLLSTLILAKAAELRTPNEILRNGVENPEAVIQLWQTPEGEARASLEPNIAPALTLKIGARDPRRLLIYTQVGDDPTILSLPLNTVDAIPKGALAFRDRTILSLRDMLLEGITIQRPDKTIKLVAGSNPMDVKTWSMIEPAKRPIDEETVTRLAVMLANLRAADLITDTPGDNLKPFGLAPPSMTVTWAMKHVTANRRGDDGRRETKSLYLGGLVPPPAAPGTRFAMVQGIPTLFTLVPEATQLVTAEMAKHRIFDIRVERVQSLTLRWADRAARFTRFPQAFSGPDDWKPEPGSNAPSIGAAELNPLMTILASLATKQFVQYDGSMREEYGLAQPRLAIEVSEGPKQPPRVLRIGNTAPGGQVYATVSLARDGPVFLLPGEYWEFWAKGAKAPPELPPNVFAP